MGRDVPQIVELLRLVFGDALDINDHHLLGGPSSVTEVFYRLNPATTRLTNGFVWQADGRIVGNVTLLTCKIWDRYLVANVAVHPTYRRRGIARALMKATAQAVQARGGRVILLQVVKENASAIELYHSLGYVSLGHVTSWSASVSRLRHIPPAVGDERVPPILTLPGHRWREAYELDAAALPADLNWPEPLGPDAYRRSLWRKFGDFMSGRQVESWITVDERGQLSGLATIASQWGQSHHVALRVRPDWAGRLERPLLAKIVRRLHYLPRGNVRVEHPDSDGMTNQLLREANFNVQRTLTHMRLDVAQ
jgi:ribosomal protein S18 acetylase RimI-like enzyme